MSSTALDREYVESVRGIAKQARRRQKNISCGYLASLRSSSSGMSHNAAQRIHEETGFIAEGTDKAVGIFQAMEKAKPPNTRGYRNATT